MNIYVYEQYWGFQGIFHRFRVHFLALCISVLSIQFSNQTGFENSRFKGVKKKKKKKNSI